MSTTEAAAHIGITRQAVLYLIAKGSFRLNRSTVAGGSPRSMLPITPRNARAASTCSGSGEPPPSKPHHTDDPMPYSLKGRMKTPWWIWAVGAAAGLWAYLKLKDGPREEWNPWVPLALAIAVALGGNWLGVRMQKENCEIWYSAVLERKRDIYNPMTMTDDESWAIAYSSMESVRPNFC